MPYTQENRLLLQSIDTVEELNKQLPYISNIINHEVNTFSAKELSLLLDDLLSFREMIAESPSLKESFYYFFDKIMPAIAPKDNLLNKKLFNTLLSNPWGVDRDRVQALLQLKQSGLLTPSNQKIILEDSSADFVHAIGCCTALNTLTQTMFNDLKHCTTFHASRFLSCNVLKENDLLTEENYRAIFNTKSEKFLDNIRLFGNGSNKKALTQELFNTLTKFPDLEELRVEGLANLSQSGLLNEKNKQIIINTPSPGFLKVCYSFKNNKDKEILTQSLFDDLNNCHDDHSRRVRALFTLNQCGLLSLENQKLIFETASNYFLEAIAVFETEQGHHNVLTQDIFDRLKKAKSERLTELKAKALLTLIECKLLSTENQDIIFNAPSSDFLEAVAVFQKQNFLTQELFDVLKDASSPIKLKAKALLILKRCKLLSVENQKAILDTTSSDFLEAIPVLEHINSFQTLLTRHQDGLLSIENGKIILKTSSEKQEIITSSPGFLEARRGLERMQSLQTVNSEKIVMQDLFNQLKTSSFSPLRAGAILFLAHQGLLTKANSQSIFELRSEEHLLALNSFRSFFPFSQIMFDCISAHQEPQSFARVLSYLNNAGLSSPENVQALNTSQDIDMRSLADFIFGLSTTGVLLTQDNYMLLVRHAPILVRPEVSGALFIDLPYHMFTQEVFTQAMQLCEQHRGNPNEAANALQNYVHRLLHRGEGIRLQPINPIQSTHNTSVHQSVAQSLIKLHQRYSKNLDVTDCINGMQAFGQRLTKEHFPMISEPVLAAAKRYLEGMNRIFDEKERGSEFTVKEITALLWRAIHDSFLISGTLQDAHIKLINHLYEIQREYNLNEQGLDDNNPMDKPACVGGAINKLVDTLNGLHPDVTIQFVTKETANAKFTAIVKEQILEYIKNHQDKSSLLASINETKTTSEDKNQTRWSLTEELWDAIKDAVEKPFFNEFKSFLKQEDLANIFSVGEYVSFDEDFYLKIKEECQKTGLSKPGPEKEPEFNPERNKERFFKLLENFKIIITSIKVKAEKNPEKYKELLKSALDLEKSLKEKGTRFFENTNPNEQEVQEFTINCRRQLVSTSAEFAKHRGFGGFKSFVKGLLGVLAALTLIPAWLVKTYSANGYITTFFGTSKTESAKQFMKIEEELDAALKNIETKAPK